MSAPFLDRSSVDTLKRALLNEFPTVKSAHLSEGLAFALGFQTHAALKAELVRPGTNHPLPALNLRRLRGNVPQTVEGWDGGCGIDYATLRSWSMLDFEGERFRAAASTQ
ncbi:hypothetical protein QZM64_40805, partial [Burkholderia cepacia]|nr:hypothetical protein [Burkholderia cepacia]